MADHIGEVVALPFNTEGLVTELVRVLNGMVVGINGLVDEVTTVETNITAIGTRISSLISFAFSSTGLVKAGGAEELVTSVTTVGGGKTAVMAVASSNGAGLPILFRLRDGIGTGGTLRNQTAIVTANDGVALLWFSATPATSYSLTVTGVAGDQITQVGLLAVTVQP